MEDLEEFQFSHTPQDIRKYSEGPYEPCGTHVYGSSMDTSPSHNNRG